LAALSFILHTYTFTQDSFKDKYRISNKEFRILKFFGYIPSLFYCLQQISETDNLSYFDIHYSLFCIRYSHYPKTFLTNKLSAFASFGLRELLYNNVPFRRGKGRSPPLTPPCQGEDVTSKTLLSHLQLFLLLFLLFYSSQLF
jgi:hypothetical protein